MPIPDYQALMLPLLKYLRNGETIKANTAIGEIAIALNLTKVELQQKISSGSGLFENRLQWAKTYLKQAGLIEQPTRGYIKITESGLQVLAENPDAINNKYLKRFPEFVDFLDRAKEQKKGTDNPGDFSEQTPEEVLGQAYLTITNTLVNQVLSQIFNLSPNFFEDLVVRLLVKMGYGGSIQDAGKAIGRTGDEGIDGIIKEDKLGLDIIYIQAKRWQKGSSVGRPEIQKFVGALAGQGAKKGIFITTASFSKDAREYVPKNETKIVLVDGDGLARLMIEYNLGVSVAQTYEIKKIDYDFFEQD